MPTGDAARGAETAGDRRSVRYGRGRWCLGCVQVRDGPADRDGQGRRRLGGGGTGLGAPGLVIVEY